VPAPPLPRPLAAPRRLCTATSSLPVHKWRPARRCRASWGSCCGGRMRTGTRESARWWDGGGGGGARRWAPAAGVAAGPGPPAGAVCAHRPVLGRGPSERGTDGWARRLLPRAVAQIQQRPNHRDAAGAALRGVSAHPAARGGRGVQRPRRAAAAPWQSGRARAVHAPPRWQLCLLFAQVPFLGHPLGRRSSPLCPAAEWSCPSDTPLSHPTFVHPPFSHDTTSTSLTQLLPLLEAHPEVVAKLREEQRRLVEKHGPGVTLAHMRGMAYADAVIRWVWVAGRVHGCVGGWRFRGLCARLGAGPQDARRGHARHGPA
jgi:hypothetical protein